MASVFQQNLDHFLPTLQSLDVVILSNAAYKTSTRIENEAFNKRLVQELLAIDNIEGKDSLIVTLVKSLRLQRLHDEQVCNYLTNLCNSAKCLEKFKPLGLVHIFAYLADALWDSSEAADNIIDMFHDKLRHNRSMDDNIRGKDIATFLWCCAQLNCSLPDDKMQYFENVLIQKVNRNEFKYFVDQLVDACLSMWMLGYKSKELLNHAIELKSMQLATQNQRRTQPKVDNRLTVLLSGAQIEEPTWCSANSSNHRLIKSFEAFNIKSNVPTYLLNMNGVPYQAITSQLNEKGVSATISNPINGINLPGVYIETATNKFFLEFMTPQQTLHFAQEPVALLRFKLRLLESLGYKTKLVRLGLKNSHNIVSTNFLFYFSCHCSLMPHQI